MLTSYTTTIKNELTLVPFLDDQKYKNESPISGVYFYDTISARVGQYEFCGPKLFSFSGTYPNCITFTGKNADILTLKAEV